MRLPTFLLLALAPLPLLAELNAYEILMFFDMYRSDYDQSGSDCKIAKACKDCNFEEFVLHIDRLKTLTGVSGRISDMMNPDIGEIEGWGERDDLVYDAKKLLGGLWRDEDDDARPGHPTVIERLVDRMTVLRETAEPSRLGKITTAMEYAHYSRRRAQADDMVTFVNGRLSSKRLGTSKTQTISFLGGQFDEFDSQATIESVQKTKRGAMRDEIVAIARDINSGSVSSTSKRDLRGLSHLSKRDFGEGMAVMSLQRGLDTLRMPARKKC
ncbi:hypothetical protein CkaCkLH20_06599 [Colletotrichum karsti]|uniref:Uncharacterized protein n=1 Tax=Colletotrichum karsti TaxID=1095194 RepID=A0A9P6I4D2_9PEZI|nr:uncharacterized protein CkaCkLH20_06599 [Colletotrichum karsti]KAF9876153.1 hypothetical protein CkaCkLH20_06599 [Colletotrichum karsti]